MSTSQEIQTLKVKDTSDWSDPIAFATTYDHVYKDDTYTSTLTDLLNNLIVQPGTTTYTYHGAGYVTTSTKDIHFTISPRKIIPDERTISEVTLNTCQIRQNNAYLVNDSTMSDVVLTVSKVSSGLRCSLKKMSGDTQIAFPNATNNDSVGVYISFDLTWA